MDNKEKIFRYVQRNPGKDITEIAAGLQMSRMTVSRYCYALETAGLIKMVNIGMRKTYVGKK